MVDNQTIPELCSDFLKSEIGPELKTLMDQFQCRVCFDPFVDPVMSVNCGHNFCSICVRKYLIYKQQCPECYEPLHEKELRPNRTLKETMHVLTKVTLPKVEKLLKNATSNSRNVTLKSSNVTLKPTNVASNSRNVTLVPSNVTSNSSNVTPIPSNVTLNSRNATLKSAESEENQWQMTDNQDLTMPEGYTHTESIFE